MEKTNIIDRITAILNNTIKELEQLKEECEAEAKFNDKLIEKIDSIASDTTALKKGVIG